MKIIFCDNGFSSTEVDEIYNDEFKSAKNIEAYNVSLISFEELTQGNLNTALKGIKKSEKKEIGIYRGWMLKPNQYTDFYNSLLEKNIQLINSPDEYKFCHYLPESYDVIKGYTPKTTYKVLKSSFDITDFSEQLKVFGDQSILIKDYVKSQKHYWNEACFIPNASDQSQVESVVRKFIELQGSDLNEGLVFREFVELEELSSHSKSGMPLTKEFRLFIKNNKIISVFKYWDEGDYQNVEPILEEFESVIPKIKSNFFTMDIAKKKNGKWIIVELGDAQVAGLPDNANRDEFYNALKND